MIRRIWAFIVFATLSHTWLLAIEKNETISPNTTSPTIGMLFDAGIPNHKFDREAYGVSMFFKKRLRQPTINHYWGVNVGYMRYKDDIKTRNDVSLTFGFGFISPPFYEPRIPITLFCGFDIGGIHKMQDDYYIDGDFHKGFNKLDGVLGFSSGFTIKITKKINFDWQMKIRFPFESNADRMFDAGLGMGLSYSL